MAEEAYPKREPFFAHKFTRLLFRCCVANDIGPEACYMLVQISHTEDAARYRRPVTFFNEQLINVCGFSNVKALDRARGKAIASGWLNYQPGAKSKPGRYFVTIPIYALDIPDGSAESDFHPGYLVDFDQVSGKYPGSIREVSGKKAGNILPTPNPSPAPMGASASSPVNSNSEKLPPLDLSQVNWPRVVAAAESVAKRVPPLNHKDRRTWLRYAVAAQVMFSESWLVDAAEAVVNAPASRTTPQAHFVAVLKSKAAEQGTDAETFNGIVRRIVIPNEVLEAANFQETPE